MMLKANDEGVQQMNYEMLNAKIEDIGLPVSAIADKIGVSPRSLKRKLRGESDFKGSEMTRISEILQLTSEERDSIFFAAIGDKSDIE